MTNVPVSIQSNRPKSLHLDFSRKRADKTFASSSYIKNRRRQKEGYFLWSEVLAKKGAAGMRERETNFFSLSSASFCSKSAAKSPPALIRGSAAQIHVHSGGGGRPNL